MKKLAGVAVFVVTLAVALLVTNYYKPRPVAPLPPPPPQGVELPPPPQPKSEVTHKVQLVTLDMEARKVHTTLALELAPGTPAPEKLWVGTSLFVLGAAENYPTEPVLVEQPFASGSRAKLTVTAACHWCGQRDAPTAGYYANAIVSTVSAEDARLIDSHVIRDHTRVTPVTVEEGRRKTR